MFSCFSWDFYYSFYYLHTRISINRIIWIQETHTHCVLNDTFTNVEEKKRKKTSQILSLSLGYCRNCCLFMRIVCIIMLRSMIWRMNCFWTWQFFLLCMLNMTSLFTVVIGRGMNESRSNKCYERSSTHSIWTRRRGDKWHFHSNLRGQHIFVFQWQKPEVKRFATISRCGELFILITSGWWWWCDEVMNEIRRILLDNYYSTESIFDDWINISLTQLRNRFGT